MRLVWSASSLRTHHAAYERAPIFATHSTRLWEAEGCIVHSETRIDSSRRRLSTETARAHRLSAETDRAERGSRVKGGVGGGSRGDDSRRRGLAETGGLSPHDTFYADYL